MPNTIPTTAPAQLLGDGADVVAVVRVAVAVMVACRVLCTDEINEL